MTHVAVIGGGAAGFFCAANAPKNAAQNFDTRIFESSSRPLFKVLQSGGGRCNLLNSCAEISELIKNYPRGGGRLRKIFRSFTPAQMAQWFEDRGVKLKEEDGGKVFPISDDARDVARTLMRLSEAHGAKLFLNSRARAVKKLENGALATIFADGSVFEADKVLIAAGSFTYSPLSKSLEDMGHTFKEPAPSLFGLKTREDLTKLSGVCVKDAKIHSSELAEESAGDLLFTFEGLSGPAALKFSSCAARKLAQSGYRAKISVNFLGSQHKNFAAEFFESARKNFGKRLLKNLRPEPLPEALWLFLLDYAKADAQSCFANLAKPAQRLLEDALTAFPLELCGRAANKKEFVVCGGLNLDEVDFATMQSKLCPNLFFAGEYLDIDAVTGGFNLMNAWGTAKIAAQAIYS